MRTIVYIVIAFSLLGFASAQDKKLDKLELLYKQENYSFAAKNAYKLINKKGYSASAEAHLFLYLSLQKIKDEGWAVSKQFRPIDDKIAFHKTQFSQLDANNLAQNKYAKYLDAKPTSSTKKTESKITTTTTTTSKEKKKDSSTSEPITSFSKRDSIVDFAMNYLNAPYRYGGTSENGFDCSGFTCFVLGNNGVSMPRSSGEIGKASEKIDVKDATKGDLLFFGKNQNSIHHVGIVISEADEPLTMIHASTSNGVIITVVPESDYWTKLLQYAGRVVN
jgi:cell wall-associated NlpC family hydrolase